MRERVVLQGEQASPPTQGKPGEEGVIKAGEEAGVVGVAGS